MTPGTLLRFAGLAALVLATACANECGPITREVKSSGRFDDTLVAVSGSGFAPGTVSLSISEHRYDGSIDRPGRFDVNTAGVVDTVALYRMTLRSDPARTPLMSTAARTFTTDSVTFERLWVHLGTEDVLFEVTGKNGVVKKALLNLESRTGPVQKCVYT
jgi:hypothetical protein